MSDPAQSIAMETDLHHICAGCDNTFGRGDPFCLNCGTLSPSLLHFGDLAVEIQEIPGKRLRAEVVAVLKSWFPALDTIRADERIRSGWHVLVRGVDEESGRRLLDALKKINLDGRLVRERIAGSWQERLVNPGLAVAAGCVLLSVMLGGTAAVILLPAAIAAPIAWALLMYPREKALVYVDERGSQYDKWSRLAHEYAHLRGQLNSQDREMVRTLTATAFDLQRRLTADSLVAIAAGEDKGDLYARLTDAIRTALSLGRGISGSKDEEERSGLQRELEALADTVSKTAAWFRVMEEKPAKDPGVLSDELHEITARIDRIMSQVRTPAQAEPQRRPRLRE